MTTKIAVGFASSWLHGVPRSLYPALLLFLLAVALLSACSSNKVLAIDSDSGYFTAEVTKHGLPDTASVVRSREFDLGSMRSIIVVPDAIETHRPYPNHKDFTLNSIKQIGYFDEVVTVSQLHARLSRLGITSKELDAAIASKDEAGVMQAIAAAYRPFVWMRWEYRQETDPNKIEFHQLVLTNALTLEDIFIVETPYQYTNHGDEHFATLRPNHKFGQSNHYYGYSRVHRSYGLLAVYGRRHCARRVYYGSRYFPYPRYYPHSSYHPWAKTVYLRTPKQRTTTLKRNQYPMFNALIDYIKEQSALGNPSGGSSSPHQGIDPMPSSERKI